MTVRVPVDDDPWKFNCWGFTAYYCRWEDKPFWMSCPQMEAHLRALTVPVSKAEVKAGDIAVFYRNNYLSHTAIVLPPGDVVCHKPGRKSSALTPLRKSHVFTGP